MNLKFYSFSIASATHPKENQDRFFIDEKGKAAGVFDGLGGVSHGEQAASWCTDCFKKRLDIDNLERSFDFCHNFLKNKASGAFDHEIATTGAIIKIFTHRNTSLVVWGSVGDSRVYKYSNNKLIQLTTDDSLITQAFERGWIKQRQEKKIDQTADPQKLNPIEKNLFQSRNIITQALGIGVMKPRIGKTGVKSGDLIILTTDGVHDNLVDKETEQILEVDSKDPAKDLVREAIRVSETDSVRAKADDITAVVVKLG